MKKLFLLLSLLLLTACGTVVAPKGKHYVSQDPEACKVIRFKCAIYEEPFFEEGGCGCQPIKVVSEENQPDDQKDEEVFESEKETRETSVKEEKNPEPQTEISIDNKEDAKEKKTK